MIIPRPGTPARPPTRIGVLGCGLIGKQHLRAWQSVAQATPGTVEITAVGDANLSAARACADQVASWQPRRPRVLSRVDQLLDPAVIDGVDVCLPVADHQPVACTAAQRGIHVLVEKPLAVTIAAGRAMMTAARQAGVVLSLAENHRRTLTIRTAAWLLRRGIIGTPELLHAQRSRYEPPADDRRWQWRAGRAHGGGGWAIDNAAHLLDTLIYLFGPIDAVTATAKRVQERRLARDGTWVVDEREDVLAALLTFANGMTGMFSVTSALPGNERFLFSIQGTDGAIVDDGGQLFHAPLPSAQIHTRNGRNGRIEDFHQAFLNSLSPQQTQRLFPYGLREDFPIECAEFLRAIRDQVGVEITAEAALQTLATSLAFYESAASGGHTVRVPDVLSGALHTYQDTVTAADALSGCDFRDHRTRWPAPGTQTIA
ncbi:gfo/Idh/MocA family oxidoreductase [Sphaerisporangium album]|uniref:Gfo/Idh/MocA family oxidoreductase n=1 Tax=Sphaerisporangium album TaxID=509200 RepID=A0A367EII9_9ACTN|nr:Gfo/Idh/MocA family oxidoreductase [Sphaerisporangium album]RCG17918.1 gfo/Idh/MocA family oxidoreductase [Sphaerisporangium album]